MWSKRVAGGEWIKRFMNKLEGEERKRVKVEKSEIIFLFGEGKKQKSILRIGLPWRFREVRVTLLIEVVDANIPQPN